MKLLVLMVLIKKNCVGILHLPYMFTSFCLERVAETTEKTISEQLVNHQQNHMCRRLYSSWCTSPSVSLNAASYRRLSPALQVFTSRVRYRSLALFSSTLPTTHV